MPFKVTWGALLSVLAQGCVGGAQLVLQQPISGQCESTGLKGCADLTHGALLFADGDPAQGRAALQKGLALNYDKPAELKKFSDAMKRLGTMPGASDYVAALRPMIALIDQTAESAAAAAAARAPAAQRPDVPQGQLVRTLATAGNNTGDPPPNNPYLLGPGKDAAAPPANAPPESTLPPTADKAVVSGFIVPTSDLSARGAWLCDPADDIKATCVVRRSPADYVVTDLLVSPSCLREVAVLAGPVRQPSWLVWIPAGRGLSEHNMQLPLARGEPLVVVVVDYQKTRVSTNDSQKPNATLGSDVRCGVTWAAAVKR